MCDFLGNVTVKVVEHELVIEGEGKRPTETGAIQTFKFNRRFSMPEDVTPDDITAVMSSEGILIITIIRRIKKVTQVKDTTDAQQTETKKTTTTTTKTTKTVTITTKGSFFKDQTFVEDVKNFEQAITTVIKKFSLKITKDAYTTYREYRKNNPKNENQAVSEKETDKAKKVSFLKPFIIITFTHDLFCKTMSNLSESILIIYISTTPTWTLPFSFRFQKNHTKIFPT